MDPYSILDRKVVTQSEEEKAQRAAKVWNASTGPALPDVVTQFLLGEYTPNVTFVDVHFNFDFENREKWDGEICSVARRTVSDETGRIGRKPRLVSLNGRNKDWLVLLLRGPKRARARHEAASEGYVVKR